MVLVNVGILEPTTLNDFYEAIFFISSFGSQEPHCIWRTTVIQVSKYTNIFGMVQMLEAFCLAPFVGAVIDFSGSVLSVNRFKSVF